MTDRALVERAIEGDSDAYTALARAAARRLFLVAHRILRDSDAAEDAVQHTLVTIWRELPRLRDPDRFDGWSYRIATRAALAEAKRQVRNRDIAWDRTHDTAAPDSSASAERKDTLERAFRQLTPEARAVVVLRYYADLPLKDIGYALGIPTGTVASRLHRAMREIRAILSIERVRAPSGSSSDDEPFLAGGDLR